jgi:serpin B
VLPLALALTAIACSSGGGGTSDCTDPSTPGCVVESAKERVQSPSTADVPAVVAENNAFAMDLYQQIRAQPGNLFYSPFSISEALAMAWAGSSGDTQTAMAATLGHTLSQARVHAAMNAVDLALASRGHDAKGADGGSFRLNVANALWGQLGFTFQQPFLDTLGTNYGAGMHIADFVKQPDDSRTLINTWVSDRTEGRIKDLLPAGSVTQDTRLVLTNAVYFNAAWLYPFDATATKPATFTKRDGSTVQVPTMIGGLEASYGTGDDYAAVALPYDAGKQENFDLEMVLVLPSGSIDDFEASLDSHKVHDIIKSMGIYGVSITMPKFKIESQFGLADALTKLGMGVAFDQDKADFSNITTADKLYISDVVHKAWVNVDEKGTEAAAATGVVFGDDALPPPAEIHLDHPYLFFIRDIPTNTILFVGRVDDPS